RHSLCPGDDAVHKLLIPCVLRASAVCLSCPHLLRWLSGRTPVQRLTLNPHPADKRATRAVLKSRTEGGHLNVRQHSERHSPGFSSLAKEPRICRGSDVDPRPRNRSEFDRLHVAKGNTAEPAAGSPGRRSPCYPPSHHDKGRRRLDVIFLSR